MRSSAEVAVDQAWTVHLAAHKDVDAADRVVARLSYVGNGKLVRAIQMN
jgi:hypothetical protein